MRSTTSAVSAALLAYTYAICTPGCCRVPAWLDEMRAKLPSLATAHAAAHHPKGPRACLGPRAGRWSRGEAVKTPLRLTKIASTIACDPDPRCTIHVDGGSRPDPCIAALAAFAPPWAEKLRTASWAEVGHHASDMEGAAPRAEGYDPMC